MARRPPHKAAHQPCPNGSANWSDCDAAVAHKWGQCKAATGDREPVPCSRWSVGEDGFCWQHYVSEMEREKREARIAIAKAELDARISAYMEDVRLRPSIWDRWQRANPVLIPAGLAPVRKRPHRLTELA